MVYVFLLYFLLCCCLIRLAIAFSASEKNKIVPIEESRSKKVVVCLELELEPLIFPFWMFFIIIIYTIYYQFCIFEFIVHTQI